MKFIWIPRLSSYFIYVLTVHSKIKIKDHARCMQLPFIPKDEKLAMKEVNVVIPER